MMYKFFIFAPNEEDVISKIIDAAADAGAGEIGKYKKCAFVTHGYGTWIADKDAHPARGNVGEIQKIDEVKIEMQCPGNVIDAVLAAVKKVHPYEEVVIDVFKLEQV